MMPVRLEPAAPWSRVKHSITEPLRSPIFDKFGEIPLSCLKFFETVLKIECRHGFFIVTEYDPGGLENMVKVTKV